MADFFTDVIKNDSRALTANRVNDTALLEPITRRKVLAIVSDCASHGVKVCVYETYRSEERQMQLFEQGATELRTVGVHHYGLAADIVPLDGAGNPTWDNSEKAFALIGHLAHVHGLITGQDWGFPGRPHLFIDQPHIQRCAEADQNVLFDGSWYPDDAYDPYKGR